MTLWENFPYFSIKHVGTHWKGLSEALFTNTLMFLQRTGVEKIISELSK